MFECNKLPVEAEAKTTHTHLYEGVKGYRMRWGSGQRCTHINLLLLSLYQWATFEVRCRHGNKTNTNDKAETESWLKDGAGHSEKVAQSVKERRRTPDEGSLLAGICKCVAHTFRAECNGIV